MLLVVLALLALVATSEAHGRGRQDPFRLSYFGNIKGRAERIRLLFRLSNRTGDLIETAIESNKWPELKPKTPFGQLPVLRHGALRLAQTLAIVQYVASQVGLSSYADISAARMASVALAVEDMQNAARPHKQTRDYQGVTAEHKKWAAYFEQWLSQGNDESEKKHFVDGKLSYADVVVYDAFQQALVDFLKVDNVEETIRTDYGAPLLAALYANVHKQATSAGSSE